MMKVLMAFVLLLGSTPGVSQAQDTPPQQVAAAQQSFAEGLDYYLWYEGAEPIRVGRGCSPTAMFLLKFQYLARNEKAYRPFRIQLLVEARDQEEQKTVQMSTISNTVRPGTRTGQESSMFATARVLSGEGYAEVVLIDPASKAGSLRRVSNGLRVRINCPEVGNKTYTQWATDWSAFVEQLGVERTRNSHAELAKVFVGKTVTWEGQVRKIGRNLAETAVEIWIAMPEVLLVTKNNYGEPFCMTFDSLKLIPDPSEWEDSPEWRGWKDVSKGQTVRFSTTLGNDDRDIWSLGEPSIFTKGARYLGTVEAKK